MASVLVPVSEAMDYLGVEDAQEIPIVEQLVDQVEALFLTQCGRRERPFQAAESARLEVHDGTGTPLLYLQYPIVSLTSILIGPNVASPVEALTIGSVDVLRYATGRTRLHRVDGGTFGTAGDPRVVHVTYDAQADLPLDAQIAILRVMAAVYRRRGSEEAGAERMGGFSADFADTAESDPVWKAALAAHWEPAFA